MTQFYIGTAGWSYLKWDKEFYPEGTKSLEKLSYYASQFNAVELNNSFYHLPSSEQFLAWQKQVPSGFSFSVKAPRYITHLKRLKDPEETLPAFLDVISLKDSGPLFFQLPPTFPLDIDRLDKFLKELSSDQRYAIEFRDVRWHNEEVYTLLRKNKVAFCLYDMPEGISPRILTSNFAYVRLRGRDLKGITPFLKEWRKWLTANVKEAFVFFDNRESKDLAFGNALAFRDLCG